VEREPRVDTSFTVRWKYTKIPELNVSKELRMEIEDGSDKQQSE
jgi:hypothetical protein